MLRFCFSAIVDNLAKINSQKFFSGLNVIVFTLTGVKSPLTWRDWNISAMWTLRYTQDCARSLMPNSNKARPPRETSAVKVTHSSLPQHFPACTNRGDKLLKES